MRTCWLLLSFTGALGAQTAAGIVVDAVSGAPVAGAYVSASVVSSNGTSTARARTDGAGYFRLQGADAAPPNILQIARTGYLPGQRNLQTMQGQGGQDTSNLRFELTPESVIAGKIVDEDGFPVERATVQALRYQEMNGERRLRNSGEAISNDLGEYRIGYLPAGRYYIRVSGGNATSWDARYLTQYFGGGLQPDDTHMVEAKAGQERGGTDVRLAKYEGVTVAGRLEGMSIKAGGPLTVVLEAEENSAVNRFSAMPRSDGRFSIPHVPPGNYTLHTDSVSRSPLKAGDSLARMPLRVGASDMSGVVLAAHAVQAVDLAGSVVMEGGGVPPRMQIALTTSTPGAVAYSDETGAFVFKGLLPGHYQVQAQRDLTGVTASSQVPVGPRIAVRLGDTDVLQNGFDLDGTPPAGPLRITLGRVVNISGKLVDAAEQPLAGVPLVLVSTHLPLRANTRTASDGSFRATLPPGDYQVYMAAELNDAGLLAAADFMQQHENDFPPVHVVAGENPPILLRRAGKQ